MAEIGDSAGDPVVAPSAVLSGHADDQRFDLKIDSRPSRIGAMFGSGPSGRTGPDAVALAIACAIEDPATPFRVPVGQDAEMILGLRRSLDDQAFEDAMRKAVGLTCGYLEGWYVAEEARHSGVGRLLLSAGEDWARSHGCVEMASDTWVDNELSQTCHEALGFEVVDRCVHYRKAL